MAGRLRLLLRLSGRLDPYEQVAILDARYQDLLIQNQPFSRRLSPAFFHLFSCVLRKARKPLLIVPASQNARTFFSHQRIRKRIVFICKPI